MQTPTKDHRRLLGGGGRGILQPKSPNHPQQPSHVGHSTSFTRYRSLTPSDDDTSCHHPGARLQATDSGYSSCLESMLSTSGSCASAENSPSSQRSHSHRMSLLNTSSNLSAVLTPILEDQELRSFGAAPSTSASFHQQHGVELTPSTRNAQQRIAAFHISTPPIGGGASNAHKRLLATPTSDDASAAKSRRLSTHASSMLLGQVTPNKHRHRTSARPSPSSGQKSSLAFMDKLLQLNDSSPSGRRHHSRDENCENSAPPTPNANQQQVPSSLHSLMDFSPIVAHTRRRAHGLHRLSSEHSIGRLQSSTPIAGAAAAAKVSANVRRMQLKTQSLSPSKLMQRLLYGTTSSSTAAVQQPPIVQPSAVASPRRIAPPTRSQSLAAPPPPINPARKLLDFNASTFESLVGPPASSAQLRSSPGSTLVRQHAVHDLTADDTGFEPSMCLDEDIEVAPMPEAPRASIANDAMKTPNRTSEAAARLRKNLSIATDADLLLLNSSIVCESPPLAQQQSSTTTAVPECSSRSITDADRCASQLLRTPKKMQRSYSMHTAGLADITDPGSASRREQQRILYANLPCTPPKSLTRRRQLKRLGGTSLVRRSPVKRKLYAVADENVPMAEQNAVPDRAAMLCAAGRRRRCYAGMHQLDMLGRLETVAPAIDRILRHLSTDDLGHMRQVCKRWQNIVESNHAAALRVERKERRYAVSKENGGVRMPAAFAIQQQPVAAKLRKPFSRCNPPDVHTIGDRHQQQQQQQQHQQHQFLVTAVVHSPPVSPSSRAFRENQAIVKTLKKSQRLMKCPRCRRSSVIERCPSRTPHVPYSSRESSPVRPPLLHHRQHSLPFTSTKSLDWTASAADSLDVSLSSSSSSSSSPDDSAAMTAASGQEFGQCPGIQCGFRFCVQCLCEFDALHGRPGGSRCVRANLVHTSQPERAARPAYVACSKQSKRNLRRLCSLDT